MNSKLRKTIIAVMTFGSFSLLMASAITLCEIATNQVDVSLLDFFCITMLMSFSSYALINTIQKVITGEEFN